MTYAWDDAKFIAFDLETSGELPEYALQPWRVAQGKAWATSLAAVKRAPTGLCVTGGLEPDKAAMEALLDEALDTKARIVGWNTAFDISWLIAYGLERKVFQAKWLDGMLLWRHYFLEPEYETNRPNKKSYGLKACVSEHLPKYAGYEKDVDFHDPSPEVRAELHRYNVKDTAFTLTLTRKWWDALLESDPRRLRAALIEADALPHVARANLHGLIIDPLRAAELQAHLRQTAYDTLTMLAPLGITETVVRSPMKLAAVLFDDWKLPKLKERSTDKEVLHELSLQDKRVAAVRKYREALNNCAKFANAPLESARYNEDGRTHPNAMVFSTYSGRLTYASKQGATAPGRGGRPKKVALPTGFALHQEKNDPPYRAIVVAPQDYTLMEFDAAGQEYRWMAVASEDTTMLSLCQPGEDPHSYMGASIVHRDYRELIRLNRAGDPQAKSDRKLGKLGNLSCQYRTSAPKLRVVARTQYNIPMELPEARKIHTTYQKNYPGVPNYWNKQIAKTKRLGYVETFAGRRVQVAGDWSGRMGWSMASTAINYRIQGTGADQKYLALSCVSNYLNKIGAYFAWDLHDGLYFYVPDDKVAQAAVDIKRILDNLPYQKAWGFTPPIPMPFDCKVGKSWGALEEYDYA